MGEAAPPSPGLVRRAWHAPLRVHLLALAVLLAALLPLLQPLAAFTSDEGAYAIQVEALEDGRWAYDYRAAPYDHTGDHFPMINSDRNGTQFFTYVKHPAYPLLMRAASAAFGRTIGLHLFPLAGVLLTALAAWLLAGQLDPRLARPAFWLAASGPVLVNGYLLWAHALSAGVAGLSLVAAVHIVRHGLRPWLAAAVAGGLAAGVLLRSEGLLFAGAVTVALAWAVLRRSGPRAAIVAGVAIGAVPVLAAVFEHRWVSAIVAGAPAQGVEVRTSGGEAEGGSFLAGRIGGAWHELFAGGYGSARGSAVALLALGLVVGFAGLAIRRRAARDVAVACGLAAAALAIRPLVAQDDAVTGLFAAWPVALLGLLLVRWRSSSPEVRMLAVTMAAFSLAVLATQYTEGGGLEWGGRFFSPLTAPIAVLAVVGLAARLPELGTQAVTAVVAVSVVTAGLGLVTVAWGKIRNDEIVAAVARHPATVTITTVESLPRLAWRLDGRVSWMLVDYRKLPAVLDRLHAAGVDTVAVVTARTLDVGKQSPYAVATVADEPALADRDGQLVMLTK